MSRYRLYPTREQERIMREHCAHARFVWNLAVEQQSWWRLGRKRAPNWIEQGRQLTEARAEFEWLRQGSAMVQHQALRDFSHAMNRFFAGTHRKPSWRKAGHREGFGIHNVGRKYHFRRLSRHVGAVQVPKLGWVKFRWSRAVPAAKSYRITLDRAGRWHVTFLAIPQAIPGPGTGEVVGIDRGVAVTLTLSSGETLQSPASRPVLRHQRRLSRAQRGSNRCKKVKAHLARLHARNADARKDWAEKASTDIARRFDVIRIEDLKIANMVRSARGTMEKPGRNVRQKAGLNRAVRTSGWGMFAKRLQDKASGRVEKINPAFTSQRCSACGHIAAESRKSQALFACVACNFTLNADLNAAINIAAGHAVTARGGDGVARPVNREPRLVPLSA